MKKLILLFSFILPLSLFAQNWSSEEKIILEKVKTGWTSWEEAVNRKDRSIWLEKTNPTENWTIWVESEAGLRNKEDSNRSFESFSRKISRFYWVNINPLKIRVDGDVGYIWFYVQFRTEFNDCTITSTEQKRLEVYRKINGEWRWDAGMISSNFFLIFDSIT